MTEIYHGPWNPAVGEKKPYRYPDDVYHRYPAAKVTEAKAEADPVAKTQSSAPSK